jgi:hypothetical protein
MLPLQTNVTINPKLEYQRTPQRTKLLLFHPRKELKLGLQS